MAREIISDILNCIRRQEKASSNQRLLAVRLNERIPMLIIIINIRSQIILRRDMVKVSIWVFTYFAVILE